MADASPIQTSFNGGIFSPLLEGHIDAPRRGASYRDSTNMIALKQGPLVRRGGTIKVFEEKLLSSGRTKLIDFIFNDEQAYLIAFTKNNAHIYRNGSIVFDSSFDQTVTGITAATPPVVTVADASGYTGGRALQLTGLTEAIEYNNRNFTAFNGTGTTFELFDADRLTAIVGVTAETSSTGLAEAAFSLTLPYTQESDLFDADGLFIPDVVQSNDVMYVTQGDFAVRVIARTADDAWTIVKLRFDNGPFQTQNFSDTEFAVTLNSGRVWDVVTSIPNVVVTSDTLDSAYGGDANDLGTATESNRLVRVQNSGGEWRWGRITKFITTTNFEFTIDDDAKNTNAVAGGTTEWALGAYSDTTGYPTVTSIHEGRLVFGATSDEPRRVDFSAIAGFNPIFTDFIPSDEDGIVRPDDSIGVTIGGGSANPIMWIESISQGLAVGTIAAEGLIRSSKNSESLTPSNATYKKSSTAGSASIQPLPIRDALLHVQFIRRRLQELTFTFDKDGFQSFDMTELAENLTRTGIVDIAYQQQPIETIWVVLTDGVLLGFTYERSADVLGWHRHVLGGTDVDVNSIRVIPSEDLDRDELWLVVTRTISGLTTTARSYVERMDRFYEDDIIQEHAYHQDCGTIYRTTEIVVSGATQADPIVITTATNHGRTTGDNVYIRGLTGDSTGPGMTALNGNTYEATVLTGTTLSIADTSTSIDVDGTVLDDEGDFIFKAYVSGGTLQESVGTFRALDYLEGEIVEVYVDGRTHANKTVAGGLVTLDDSRTGANVSIGLPHEWTFKSHRVESGSVLGTAQGKIKQFSQVVFRLLSTLGFQYGEIDGQLDEDPFDYGTDIDSMTPLFTGDKQVDWPIGFEKAGRIEAKGTGPFPAQIQSIMPQVKVAEKPR